MGIWFAVLSIVVVTAVLIGAIYWREWIRLKKSRVEKMDPNDKMD